MSNTTLTMTRVVAGVFGAPELPAAGHHRAH